MIAILADHNIEGQAADAIGCGPTSEGWQDLARMRFFEFADVGLPATSVRSNRLAIRSSKRHGFDYSAIEI